MNLNFLPSPSPATAKELIGARRSSLTSSTSPAAASGRLFAEPAFIETDFSVPLVIDASSTDQAGRNFANDHRHRYHHDIEKTSSSSPSAAVSPSPSAASPALPIVSPGVIVSRRTPIFRLSSSSSSSLGIGRLKPMIDHRLQRPHLAAGRDGPPPGYSGGFVAANHTATAASTKQNDSLSSLRNYIRMSSFGEGFTNLSNRPAPPEVRFKSVRRLPGELVPTPQYHHPVVSHPVSRNVRTSEATRSAPVSRQTPVSGVFRTDEYARGLPEALVVTSSYHRQRALLQAAEERRHQQDVAHFEQHKSSSSDRKSSATIERHQSGRQFQLVDGPMKKMPPVQGAHLSSESSTSSHSGRYVFHLQQSPRVCDSLLRPALMRLGAISSDIRSPVNRSSASVGLKSAATLGRVASVCPVSAAAVAGANSGVSDLTSHYRIIQPKPNTGPSSSSSREFASAQHVGSMSSTVGPPKLASKNGSSIAVSRPVPDRSPSKTSSFVVPTSSARRHVLGVPSSLSSSPTMLSVPRVPTAAHYVSPTMRQHPVRSPNRCPPQYVQRTVTGTSRSGSIDFGTSSTVCATLPSSAYGRSAHRASSSSSPRFEVDSFDPLPLDCSRKKTASSGIVVESPIDVDYVLNLTTSGSASSRAFREHSEVIDLSGGGSSASSDGAQQRPMIAEYDRWVKEEEEEKVVIAVNENGELENLTVANFEMLAQQSDDNNVKHASLIGLMSKEHVEPKIGNRVMGAVENDVRKTEPLQFDQRCGGGIDDATAAAVNSQSLTDAEMESAEDLGRRLSLAGVDVRSLHENGRTGSVEREKLAGSPAASIAMEPITYEEREFIWDDYLEENKATAVPATSFKHVEYSLQSGFVKGMMVEVSNRNPPGTYWVASIIVPCGELLQLRPLSTNNDATHDFWCNVGSADIHSLGWCLEHQKTLCPPEELAGKLDNWQSFISKSLEGAISPPSFMLDPQTGTLSIDQIKEGMYLEAQLDLDPDAVWFVKVIENVGGRLLLRYEGDDGNDFWLFYLHHRLHPVGWAQSHSCSYQLPTPVKKALQQDDFNWEQYRDKCLTEAKTLGPPCEIFQDQATIEDHRFVKGWKLEALHRQSPCVIRPATVTHIFNAQYFLIELDNLSSSESIERICCHARSIDIFPVGWCSANHVQLAPVPGYKKANFEWEEYLKDCSAEPAPESVFSEAPDSCEFELGMKLEAVNPSQPGQICAATIVDVISGRLLRLRLDHLAASDDNTFLYPVDSFDIFPIGWAESNEYQLKAPKMWSRVVPVAQPTVSRIEKAAPIKTDIRRVSDERTALYQQMKEADGRSSGSWCPKIYFNYRCFTGPYLSKGRLVLLPQFVGPGPVVLVLREVLSMLINVAYKPSRVLRELQFDGPPNPNMHQEVLQAKYNGKSYSAKVEICKTGDQVDEFCRQVCHRLQCCLNLVSPHCITASSTCPNNCSQLSKTKFTNYFGKKGRKIGRPPGGHSNLDSAVKKNGKRRRHRKIALTIRKKHSAAASRAAAADAGVDDQDGGINGRFKKMNGSNYDSLEDDSGVKSGTVRAHNHQITVSNRKRKARNFSVEPLKRKRVHIAAQQVLGNDLKRRKTKKIFHELTVDTNGLESSEASPCLYYRKVFEGEEDLKLDSNPLHWTVRHVADFLMTTDCALMTKIIREQEIDGQSFMMLSLPTIQEYLGLKLGPAIKLCHQIERVKVAFFETFA